MNPGTSTNAEHWRNWCGVADEGEPNEDLAADVDFDDQDEERGV